MENIVHVAAELLNVKFVGLLADALSNAEWSQAFEVELLGWPISSNVFRQKPDFIPGFEGYRKMFLVVVFALIGLGLNEALSHLAVKLLHSPGEFMGCWNLLWP